MKTSQILASLFWALQIVNVSTGNIIRSPECDVSYAYSSLEALSTGNAFCSSLLYPEGPSTETEVITPTGCTTETKTKVIHATFTDTKYHTILLPSITITEYSSTVLIPSGTTLAKNKREVTSTSTTSISTSQTTTTLTTTTGTTCGPKILSSACSSLIKPSTVTITVTQTVTQQCATTTVFTTTKFDGETTITQRLTASPPPDIIYTSATLTTTVPAACAGSAFDSHGNGVGNIIMPLGYPYFAQTAVECCLFCFDFQNCVASAFIASALDCQLLIKVNATIKTARTDMCPLGIENYKFGSPKAHGDVYPGPCGF